ncbi:MAG: anhydro-N-acetylmuramic acid kinase [Xanthomonadales bacterium]|nr:anhydro-N-acetylmuramic acid kinase [Xanthomonadales bacterium]
MRNGSDDRFFIGMLSGTSRDGVDTVLVHFSNNLPKVIASYCVAYPAPLQEMLRKMIDRRIRPAEEEMAVVTEDLAEVFALSVWALLDQAGVKAKDVVAIGSHGQTVWHRPTGKNPESIQLGRPQLIANLTGIPTVGNFRQADIAAGGQGAPLAPLLHGALLMPAGGVRAVLNIGGISNISVLAANGMISGYDTGPGNCLLDAWVKKHEGSDFDDGGQWAAGGTADGSLLELLLADPYFALPPPKSTGVEYFNIYWLKKCMDEHASAPAGEDPGVSDRPGGPPGARDVQATLSELTARSVATAVRHSGASELLVCGGGVHNLDLLKRLQRLLPDTRVGPTSDSGIDPDLVEAILFAWLARERIANRALDTRRITGAREPVVLGEVFDPA